MGLLPFLPRSFTLNSLMAIRFLALDLDGTLLNRRGEVSVRNREALDAARERGVHVAVVTGRRFRDSRPIALELGLDIPVISHNGALTKHARTLETVAVLPLPLEQARQALKIGRASGADPLLSDDHEGLGVLVYDHLSGDNTAVHKYIAWARGIHGDEEGQRAVQQVQSLDEYLDHDPIHLAFSGTCSNMDQLEQTLNHEMGVTIKILCTKYPKENFTLLDILNSAASKGAGVAAAAAELDLEAGEVMAIGDNYNDLEMLLFAGTGVVMANAPQSLREIEGLYPTTSQNEDGVALAVEKFILNQ
jgi:Cof subfamily protein (haloacid dehalogenase superfamily)